MRAWCCLRDAGMLTLRVVLNSTSLCTVGRKVVKYSTGAVVAAG
jgi:hypothetical protein